MFTKLHTHPQADSSLTCNVVMLMSRILKFGCVFNSAGDKKLALSPDTDVYTIGLPLISETNLDVIVT